MFFFRAIKYLRYFFCAGYRRGHNLHSPFAFDLVSRIFRNKIDPDIVCIIEKIRNDLLKDQRSIIVNDLGAGSENMKTNIRKVSDIAHYSAVPKKYGMLLSGMSAEFGEPAIIEFGTSLGISTMYLASSCPGSVVYTMEGCSATAEIAELNFRKAGMSNITLIKGAFGDILPELKKKAVKPGLVFIDGNHRKEPVLNYFEQMVEISGDSTVIIIDDIYSSKEMAEAWTQIKNHGKVTLSIDIYRMGILFFRKGMSSSGYMVRY